MKAFLGRAAALAAVYAAILLAAEGGWRLWLALEARRAAPEGAYRLYAIGESTTRGQPYSDATAFPSLTADDFGGRLAGRPVAVVNLARAGDTLYPQALGLVRALRFRPRGAGAAVLIYAGHNEAFSPNAPAWARRIEALKRGSLGRSFFLSDLILACERRFRWPRVRSPEVYDYWLRRAVEAALASGAVPVVSTVISNIADIEPPAPYSPDGDFAAEDLRKGLALERSGKTARALEAYRSGLKAWPGYSAQFIYRIAKLEEARGDYAAAREDFWRAVDEDPRGSFGRATREQNALIRRAAADYKIPLVDAAADFEAASPHGLVGARLMSDGQHPTIEGDALLAAGFARALSKALGEPLSRTLAGADEVYELHPFDRNHRAAADVGSGMMLLSVALPHPWPADTLNLAERRFREADALRPGLQKAWLGLGLAQAARGRDYSWQVQAKAWMVGQGSAYMAAFGDPVPRAQLDAILEKYKGWGVPAATLARLVASADQRPEQDFASTPEGRRSRALLLQSQGKAEEAERLLEGLVKEQPGNALWRMDLGVAQSLTGHTRRAAESLEAALRLDPGLLPAYLSLGALYASSGCAEKAQSVFRRAPKTSGKDAALRRAIQGESDRLSASPGADAACALH